MDQQKTILTFRIPGDGQGQPNRFSIKTPVEQMALNLHPFEKSVLDQLMTLYGAKKSADQPNQKEPLTGFGLALYGLNGPTNVMPVPIQDLEGALVYGSTRYKQSKKIILDKIPAKMLDKGRPTLKKVISKNDIIVGPFLAITGLKILCSLLVVLRKGLMENNLALTSSLINHAVAIGLNKLPTWENINNPKEDFWLLARGFKPSHSFNMDKGVLSCYFSTSTPTIKSRTENTNALEQQAIVVPVSSANTRKHIANPTSSQAQKPKDNIVVDFNKTPKTNLPIANQADSGQTSNLVQNHNQQSSTVVSFEKPQEHQDNDVPSFYISSEGKVSINGQSLSYDDDDYY